MEDKPRKVLSAIIVIFAVYLMLGLVGVLPAQYDAVRRFSTNVEYGGVEEFTIPEPVFNPLGITHDADGNIWFTGYSSHKVCMMTPNGQTFQSYNINALDLLRDLAFDTSGNLWITGYQASNIYKFDTNHQVTIYKDWADSYPTGIDTDNKGYAWFCGSMQNYIAKQKDNFPLYIDIPSQMGTHPYDLVADNANGYIWISMYSYNIVKYTISTDKFTKYAVPTFAADSQPRSIDMDAEGNIWFADAGQNKIIKMTQGGKFTSIGIPTANSKPDGISVNKKNGDVWFAEVDGNKIGRVRLAGGSYQVDEFAVSGRSGNLNKCIVDDSSNVFFPEFYSNKIGKLTATETPKLPIEEHGITIAIAKAGKWVSGGTGGMAQDAGIAIIIQAYITTTGKPILNASLNYIGVDNVGNPLAMTLISGNTTAGYWQATIPAQAQGTLTFYIRASTSGGYATTPINTLQVTSVSAGDGGITTSQWVYGGLLALTVVAGVVVNRQGVKGWKRK